MQVPASAGVMLGRSNPYVRSNGNGTIVQNVEVAANVAVSATVGNQVVQCNPVQVGAWLTGLAANYSKWRWRSLRFFYVPVCPTSTPGSIHMGLQYDNVDAAPSTVATISALSEYTTGPVWNGFEAASALSRFKSGVPGGSVCVCVDVTRAARPWYPYITQASFQAQANIAVSLSNEFSPARLIILTSDGPVVAVSAGRVYAQYEIELIEPIAASTNL